MSNRAVISALVVAILLGVVTLVLLNGLPVAISGGSPGVAVDEKLFDFAPSSVVKLSVQTERGRESIQRLGATSAPKAGGSGVGENPAVAPSWAPDAEWLWQGAAANDAAWPIPTAQVQGLLRLLADARAVAPTTSQHDLGASPVIVTLVFRDGTKREIRFAQRTLAGVGLVEVDEPQALGVSAEAHQRSGAGVRRAMISDELHRALTTPGPRAWRQRDILAGLTPEASRIKLQNGVRALALGKVDSKWTMREPVSAPVDPAAVHSLLGTLSKILIDDFLDSGPGIAKTGLDPAAGSVLTVESDRRSLVTAPDSGASSTSGAGDVKVETLKLELAIGDPSDAQSKRLYARLNAGRPLLLAAAGLESLTLNPCALLWPAPTAVLPVDISGLRFEPTDSSSPAVEYARVESQWMEIPGRQPLSDVKTASLEGVLAFLTGADRASPANAAGKQPPRPECALEQHAGYRPVATLRLFSGGSSGTRREVESIEIGGVPDTSVVFRTGRVFRTYSMAQTPEALGALLKGVVKSHEVSAEPTGK